MTEQQLNKIEKQWNNADCDDLSLVVNHIFALLAEVRKLQEKLQYEETCHAEAQEEVRRLNRMVYIISRDRSGYRR